ncbi:MAG TPA: HPF/RaiA family ribosome-associated protein [Thermodesulfobacteriota bacterium]
MDVEIENQCRDIPLQESWRTLIDARVRDLETRYPRMVRLHVTLKHDRHHRQGADEVALLALMPGRTLRVDKVGEKMTDALHAAFEVLERELAEYAERLRRFGKPPGPRPQGIIHKLFPERGYGFVLLPEGEEVYFHRNALHDLEFEALSKGQPVEVEVEEGRQGPQASRVFPVGERWTA